MPVVRVFILDSQERVLLVKTDHKQKGPENVYWIVPGGMIEEGEYSRDAAIREVKEETGLDISERKRSSQLHPLFLGRYCRGTKNNRI